MASNELKGNNKRLRYANLEGWVSIIVNILLAVIKYAAGLLSGSVALIADAWHTLSDSISSIFIIIGARMSAKPADEKHPFGHGRIEFITTLLVASLLLIVAYAFSKESVGKFMDHSETVYNTFAIVAIIISIAGKEGLANFAFYCARKSDSEALRADGWHHRSDSISSIIILAGIILGKSIWWIDSLLGIIVSLFIAYTGIKLILNTASRIIGEKPDEKTISNVIKLSESVTGPGIEPYHFRMHDYVTHKEMTFHIGMDPDMNIRDAHSIIDQIERKIGDKLNIETTIHIEPRQGNN